jgi:hypothetical protein
MSKEEDKLEHDSAMAELEKLEVDIVEDKPQSNLPSKFQGKSAEEIAQSYIELESAYGKRNNEYGQLKRMADELMELKKTPPVAKKPLDVDSLLDNPSTAINDAIDSNPRLSRIEQQLQQQALKEAKQAFESKHPDWNEVNNDPQFKQWVLESPTRQKMYAAADANYNYEVGDELFSTWKQLHQASSKKAGDDRKSRIQDGLRAASTETGLGTAPRQKIYRREDLINMRIMNPEKYAAIEPDVRQAYAEGRVR